MIGAERMRQQVFHSEGRAQTLRPCDMHARLRVGEFANALAAAAAWRAQRLAVADDEDVDDAPLARQDQRGDRRGLRASAFGIGGVFDVAAAVDRAARPQRRRADFEPRLGRIGVALRRPRRREQRVEPIVSAL
jgi:hypothetical protein